MGLLNEAISMIKPSEDIKQTSPATMLSEEHKVVFKKAIAAQKQKDYLLLTNFSFLLWAIFDAI